MALGKRFSQPVARWLWSHLTVRNEVIRAGFSPFPAERCSVHMNKCIFNRLRFFALVALLVSWSCFVFGLVHRKKRKCFAYFNELHAKAFSEMKCKNLVNTKFAQKQHKSRQQLVVWYSTNVPAPKLNHQKRRQDAEWFDIFICQRQLNDMKGKLTDKCLRLSCCSTARKNVKWKFYA